MRAPARAPRSAASASASAAWAARPAPGPCTKTPGSASGSGAPGRWDGETTAHDHRCRRYQPIVFSPCLAPHAHPGPKRYTLRPLKCAGKFWQGRLIEERTTDVCGHMQGQGATQKLGPLSRRTCRASTEPSRLHPLRLRRYSGPRPARKRNGTPSHAISWNRKTNGLCTESSPSYSCTSRVCTAKTRTVTTSIRKAHARPTRAHVSVASLARLDRVLHTQKVAVAR